MSQDKLENLNFHEWFIKYNEGIAATSQIQIGGASWALAFAAWQYIELLTKQKSEISAWEAWKAAMELTSQGEVDFIDFDSLPESDKTRFRERFDNWLNNK